MDFFTEDDDFDEIPDQNVVINNPPASALQHHIDNNNDANEEKIPCELCDELIDFEDYGLHQVNQNYNIFTI